MTRVLLKSDGSEEVGLTRLPVPTKIHPRRMGAESGSAAPGQRCLSESFSISAKNP
jgi:hypothetical protein